ncbi:hypothetical protein [Brachybacterium sp. YJGR34]|uniref:hypothetical protein n=1 Tax=Brachybacterium sp. YJGR34 TaxID=2059911 RepID=UPI000E09EE09|nr:hypothetical protein [Brachybacterium sp. YJGR34]
MTSIMRRTVRGVAAGLGALAIVAGAAACGGNEEEPTTEETEVVEDEGAAADEEDGASDEGAEEDAASDEGAEEEPAEEDGADEGATEVTEDDLTAAEQQAIAFFSAIGEQDAEAACGLVYDPAADAPISGDVLAGCAEGLESTGMMESFTPEVVALFTEDTLESTANEDGTITVSASGSPFTMVKASDGKWYLSQDFGG